MKSPRTVSILFLILTLLGGIITFPAYAFTPKQIYQKAGPGVVFIFASKGSSKGNGGTGSIISRDGLVITNAHIFTQKDSSDLLTDISIFLKPARVTGNHKSDLANGYRGKIVAYDIPLDLALVQIVKPDKALTVIPFADSEAAEIGDTVYAIGHPEQGGLWSLTSGVISAYWGDYGGVVGKDMFQTDASINRGNSGGPLLDEYGTMIGINSMIARKAADGLTITDVNFSIRSHVAIDWLNQKGFHMAAVSHQSDEAVEAPPKQIAAAPAQSEKKVAAAPPEPKKEIALAPKQTEKKAAPYKQPPEEKEKQKVIVKQPQAPKSDMPSLSSPQKQKTLPLKKEPTQKKMISEVPQEGQILTEKRPYRMDELLEGMREMEDLMDEMKGMIDEFRERRKK